MSKYDNDDCAANDDGSPQSMVTIVIKYGIGYGSHETDMDVPVDATDEEIHQMVWDMLAERLDYGWEKQ